MQRKVMRTMPGLFAEIERDLIKMRVHEEVKAAQEKGDKFGRPKGVGCAMSLNIPLSIRMKIFSMFIN